MMGKTIVKLKQWEYPLIQKHACLFDALVVYLFQGNQGVWVMKSHMRIGVVALASVALVGCASTASVLAEEPTEVFHSTRSVNEIAFCLANKNNVSALDQDDGSKVVLLKNGYGGLSLSFTIIPEGEGSRIEYRRAFGTIGAAWRQCVIDEEAAARAS